MVRFVVGSWARCAVLPHLSHTLNGGINAVPAGMLNARWRGGLLPACMPRLNFSVAGRIDIITYCARLAEVALLSFARLRSAFISAPAAYQFAGCGIHHAARGPHTILQGARWAVHYIHSASFQSARDAGWGGRSNSTEMVRSIARMVLCIPNMFICIMVLAPQLSAAMRHTRGEGRWRPHVPPPPTSMPQSTHGLPTCYHIVCQGSVLVSGSGGTP